MSKKLVPSGLMPLPLPLIIVPPDGAPYCGKYSSFVCIHKFPPFIYKTAPPADPFVPF